MIIQAFYLFKDKKKLFQWIFSSTMTSNWLMLEQETTVIYTYLLDLTSKFSYF